MAALTSGSGFDEELAAALAAISDRPESFPVFSAASAERFDDASW
jgi:hypothetical protein